MNWFRFFSDSYADPKVDALSDRQFRFWVNLMCLSASETRPGSVPDASRIGRVLRRKPSEVKALLGDLLAAGLISQEESGQYVVTDWPRRQLPTDDAAARSKKYRCSASRSASCSASRSASEALHEALPLSPPDSPPTPPSCIPLSLELPPIPPPGGYDPEVSRPGKAAKKPKPVQAEMPPLPDWLPLATWQDWLEHRLAIKKPMSPSGAKAMFSRLEKRLAAGEDPVELMELAMANGWQGAVFESRPAPAGSPGRFRVQPEDTRPLPPRFMNTELDRQRLARRAAKCAKAQ